MNTKVLLVSQWYPPEPVEVPRSIARSIADQGLDVTVLTGIPNYPHGRVTPGYRAWRPSTDVADGIRVQRTPLYPSHDTSAVRRMGNYLSWAASSTTLGAPALRRADVALVYSSPATAALGPVVWKSILKTPYVLMIQDLWPDSVVASGMMSDTALTRTSRRTLSSFVSATYRRSAHIITISPGMKSELVARGVPSHKISLIYNWSPEEDGPERNSAWPEARSRFDLDNSHLVLSYAGNLGAMQGLDTLVLAARIARDQLPVQVLIAGDGVESERLRSLADREGAHNVRFLGRLDSEAMGSLRTASDIQFVGLVDEPIFEITMPSKMQAILASGSPILACAPGDAARIVRDSGAGWTAQPGVPASIVSALREAWLEGPSKRAERGRRAWAYYQQHMSRATGAPALARVLRTAADPASPAPQHYEEPAES